MALASGELSSLSGAMLLMTATATPSTVRILQNQLPEINDWQTIMVPPLRENVTLIVPPPEILSSDINAILDPFINDMKQNNNFYLIIVRGMIILYFEIEVGTSGFVNKIMIKQNKIRSAHTEQ